MLLLKICTVVLEDEDLIFNSDGGLGRASVVRVLKKLREDMSRILNLLEQQMPWTGELRILF